MKSPQLSVCLAISLPVLILAHDDHSHGQAAKVPAKPRAQEPGIELLQVEIRDISGIPVIAVPIDSVYQDGQSSYVLTKNDEKAQGIEKRVVKLGRTDGEYFEAMEGVLPGDVVVIGESPFQSETGRFVIGQNKKIEPVKSVVRPSNPDSVSKLYGIQIGAFSNLQNAEKFATEVKARFEKRVDVLKSESGGRILYKVRMGEFDSPSAAKTWSKQLSSTQFPNAFVVNL